MDRLTRRSPAARPRPLADRHRHVDQDRDAARQVVPARAADVDAAPARPALRRPPDRARRLPAQRSYSIASSPLDEGEIELTIDRLDDGEVSPYFHDVVVEGDQVEVRGPFASYFVWRGEEPVAAGRRRLGRRAADVDAAPPAADDARAADAARLLGPHRPTT